jgi:hypothetical protein
MDSYVCPWNDTTNWSKRLNRCNNHAKDFVQFAADNGCTDACMVLFSSC